MLRHFGDDVMTKACVSWRNDGRAPEFTPRHSKAPRRDLRTVKLPVNDNLALWFCQRAEFRGVGCKLVEQKREGMNRIRSEADVGSMHFKASLTDYERFEAHAHNVRDCGTLPISRNQQFLRMGNREQTILAALGEVFNAGAVLCCLVHGSDYQRQQNEALLSRKLAFVDWAEAVRISALHGSGLRELFKAIHRAHASATKQFSTAEVTKALEIAYETSPPPVVRGHVAKLRFAHPGGENPPTFIVHGTRLRTLSDSYRRYLENFFRKRFKLVGTPVRFVFKEGENPYEGKRNVLTERQVAKKKRLIRHVKRGK